jgi:hypothetical protein
MAWPSKTKELKEKVYNLASKRGSIGIIIISISGSQSKELLIGCAKRF